MTRRRVVVTGAGGQLGRAIQALDRPDWDLFPFSSVELDVRDWRAVRSKLTSLSPDLVIHAAAATNVDRCEREPEWAYEVNALGARNVAQAAALVGAELVYVSTNYVFDGAKPDPYHEFDATGPISAYGRSKLAGEDESRAATSRCYVVRTASVFDSDGRNFVNTMRGLMERLDRITVVDDQISNPTYASDLAHAIGLISQDAPFGTYHATNAGVASWYEWACEIRRHVNADCDVVPIPASEYRRDAQPPENGAMTSLALPKLGITLPEWQAALERCLAQ